MGEGALEPAPLYYNGTSLEAVRLGRFKYHRERGVDVGDYGGSFKFRTDKGPWLFDLSLDPSESYDVSSKYPELMERMSALLEARDKEMKTNPRGWR